MQEYLQDILNLDGGADDGDLEAQEMLNCFQDACLERACTYLGSSIYRNHIVKETWWWNEDVKDVVHKKKESYKAWSKCPHDDLLEKMRLRQEYKRCRKAAKRICAQTQAASLDEMYNELEKISTTAAIRDQIANELQVSSKCAETTIFKIVAQRRRHTKEIDSPKFINDEDSKLLTRPTHSLQMAALL